MVLVCQMATSVYRGIMPLAGKGKIHKEMHYAFRVDDFAYIHGLI